MKNLVRTAYNRLIRPRLPRKLAVCSIDEKYGGVITRRVKLFDSTDVWENYEVEFLSAIREFVEPRDDVLEVGGGFGVATVTAARYTGPDGYIRTLEASEGHVEYVQEAAYLNGVDERVEVEHALVGPAKDVWGANESAARYPADKLGEWTDPDVLLLDCEGAEADIIENLSIRPRVCIVEVHPHLIADVDNPVLTIRKNLESQGYQVMKMIEEVEKSFPVSILVFEAE